MGSALAQVLTANGLKVLGYDVNPASCRELAAIGGKVASDAGEVIRGCDRILLSLPSSDIVQEVLTKSADHLRRGHLLIDATTGVPAEAAALGQRLAEQGIHYLDATISGSSAQICGAETVVLAGGDAAAFEQCQELFRLFARKAFHVGPCGSGSTMKLVVNLVLGLNRAALAEGLSFAKAVGLDPAAALIVLKESAAHSRIMDGKGEKMLNGEFSPQARLSQHLKDVRIILSEGFAAGIALPLSQAHRGLLEIVEAAGYGQLDNSAIIRAFDPLCVRKEDE
jgi:3-hydroxyisobutyrate dehydrogenase-like beta-hydroxyacid dehydrogenase